MRRIGLFLFLIALSIPAPIKHVHADDHTQDTAKDYNITEIRDGIFRTQQGPYYGIVLEGTDSLLVFDTFSKDYATWLNTKLAEQFNKPVKYVIYSHNHADHVSGGQAFAGHDPLYISHAMAKESMARMNIDTRLADLTFTDSLQIDFEGLDIELQYWGENDGRGSISMFVPEKKFIAAVDWALTDRAMYKALWRYNVEGIIRSVNAIEKLDWDLISPGHAGTGNKDDLARFKRYVTALRDGVLNGINDGQSEEQIVDSVMTDLRAVEEFRTLKMFEEWAPLNIRGTYRQLAAIEGQIAE